MRGDPGDDRDDEPNKGRIDRGAGFMAWGRSGAGSRAGDLQHGQNPTNNQKPLPGGWGRAVGGRVWR